ncbi:hypothetical protein ACO0QE_003994 [Hanseniaspora vineae]
MSSSYIVESLSKYTKRDLLEMLKALPVDAKFTTKTVKPRLIEIISEYFETATAEEVEALLSKPGGLLSEVMDAKENKLEEVSGSDKSEDEQSGEESEEEESEEPPLKLEQEVVDEKTLDEFAEEPLKESTEESPAKTLDAEAVEKEVTEEVEEKISEEIEETKDFFNHLNFSKITSNNSFGFKFPYYDEILDQNEQVRQFLSQYTVVQYLCCLIELFVLIYTPVCELSQSMRGDINANININNSITNSNFTIMYYGLFKLVKLMVYHLIEHYGLPSLVGYYVNFIRQDIDECNVDPFIFHSIKIFVSIIAYKCEIWKMGQTCEYNNLLISSGCFTVSILSSIFNILLILYSF